MRAKSMVLILIALGCGLVASIAISQVMERGSRSANAGLETVPIYVASTDIDVNEQLSATQRAGRRLAQVENARRGRQGFEGHQRAVCPRPFLCGRADPGGQIGQRNRGSGGQDP